MERLEMQAMRLKMHGKQESFGTSGTLRGRKTALYKRLSTGQPNLSGYQERVSGYREQTVGTSGTQVSGHQEQSDGISGTAYFYNQLRFQRFSASKLPLTL